MFDIVRNNQKIIQIVLALIILPFAFFGVESYFKMAGVDNEAARVDSIKISVGEFQQALREQQDRLRPALGGGVDPALLDSPQLRRSVIDNLVNQRLLALYAHKAHLAVSDQQLLQFIMAVPALQENGQFSRARYEAVVASQGMSVEMFEARVRQDMAMQQLLMAVSDGAIPGTAAADRWLGAQLEEREIAEVLLRPEQYVAQAKVTPDAVKAFYEANIKRFETPEQVRAEYLVLSRDQLLAQATVSEAEIKAAYESRAGAYKQPEQRRASHILIKAAQGAPEAEVKAAEAKAAELLAQVRQVPNDFAKLAKQHSQDPGSAERGGDLDWFGRGMMVKPFEDAVFGLKEGQVSDVVRSDFGFHIIKVTGIRAERVKPLEEVRADIVAELKQQAAAKKYAELAESFSNTVYEQADSLAPAAEKFKTNVQQSDWLTKGGAAEGYFANSKLMAALFSEDAVRNKRNTDAVEVAPNTLVAARVLEHKPAALQPLESVAASIEKLLLRQEAAKLAAREGEEKLARLGRGEAVDLAWGQSRSVLRSFAPNLAPEAVKAIFKADVAKLPAYAGVTVPGGYALYRISQAKPFAAGAEESARVKAMKGQYARLVAEQELDAWLATLKERYDVVINPAIVEAKER